MTDRLPAPMAGHMLSPARPGERARIAPLRKLSMSPSNSASPPSSGFADWTKNKLLPAGLASPNGAVGAVGTPFACTFCEFGVNSEVVLGFDNRLEVWKWHHDALVLAGALKTDTRIISAKLLPSVDGSMRVLVQRARRHSVGFDVYDLDDRLIQSLVLPPASNGLPPYSVVVSPRYICILTAAGAVTVFSATGYEPLALSGLQTRLANGTAVFDLSGRFLAYSPAAPDAMVTPVPVVMADELSHAPFVEKLASNIGVSAVTSVRTLSRTSVSGIKEYIKTGLNGSGGAAAVHVVDITTGTVVAAFVPPDGLSSLRFSPSGTELVTSSGNSDYTSIYSILSLPRQITLVQRLYKGLTSPSPARTLFFFSSERVGVQTTSGTFHSISAAHKFKIPACDQAEVFAPGGRVRPSRMLLRRGGLLMVVSATDGDDVTYYVLPTAPCGPNLALLGDTPASSPRKLHLPGSPASDEAGSPRAKGAVSPGAGFGGRDFNPLALAEIETCKSFIPLHLDRRIEFSVYKDDTKPLSMDIIGTPIETVKVSSGLQNGDVEFFSDIELQHAIEAEAEFVRSPGAVPPNLTAGAIRQLRGNALNQRAAKPPRSAVTSLGRYLRRYYDGSKAAAGKPGDSFRFEDECEIVSLDDDDGTATGPAAAPAEVWSKSDDEDTLLGDLRGMEL
ncbi:uncharacterized protein V1510DRAFT_218955 [Dipodascopsis tothii]|uniref:uncharacterized protein n=1 Tax=Dipodascopsis tothii TaxID=44089 RepID=UPI0034CF66CE